MWLSFLYASRQNLNAQIGSFFRNTLNEIYFGKTRDIVNGLRSVQPLSEGKAQEELRKDLITAIAKKNAGATP